MRPESTDKRTQKLETRNIEKEKPNMQTSTGRDECSQDASNRARDCDPGLQGEIEQNKDTW